MWQGQQETPLSAFSFWPLLGADCNIAASQSTLLGIQRLMSCRRWGNMLFLLGLAQACNSQISHLLMCSYMCKLSVVLGAASAG